MTGYPEDIPLHDALDLLVSATTAVNTTETIALDDARGRILREDVVSPINVPQQDVAAVDGYAFCHHDLTETPLPVTGSIKAGHPYNKPVERGFAYRIFTGAPMPPGLDTIAMQEHCSIDDAGSVTLPQRITAGTNFRPAGENVAEGEVVLTAGTRLGPSEIGLAAAIGTTELTVAPRLTVAILSMGDEVVESGSAEGVDEGMIHDSNRPMLRQLLEADGHQVLDLGIVNDDLTTLTRTYGEAAGRADVILSSGGSSEGDEDHARAAITANGGVIDFWRLALKPGRPMAAGRIGTTPVYCVPGNPVAAFVCTRLLVAPLLTRLQGGRMTPPLKLNLPSGFAHRHRKGRAEYLRARIDNRDGDGKIVLNGRKGAGVLSSLTGADGLVEIPADHDDVTPGDLLPFIMLRESGL
ncbi:MAG: molybdopterin molybdotransferase MoeA [Alphaproteobacteria bacterium]|nr:molybdopterin molybdotransferase MoeA [Alphaproteobacteria bacterium]